MNKLVNSVKAILVCLCFSAILAPQPSPAQDELSCGDIIENTIGSKHDQHKYSIALNAGDKINVSAKVLGDTMRMALFLHGPTGRILYRSRGGWSSQPSAKSGVLSASGNYTIRAVGNVGVYTMFVECTKRDGTVIKPGEIQKQDAKSSTNDDPTQQAKPPQFAGVGFIGLPPVDFSNATRMNLLAGIPVSATFTPGGRNLIAFALDAKSNDVFDLAVTRESGNLDLGLVVLYPKNQVCFQSSLVTSDRLSTRLTLPADGQYTIGVFQPGLVKPKTPKATAFKLVGKINP